MFSFLFCFFFSAPAGRFAPRVLFSPFRFLIGQRNIIRLRLPASVRRVARPTYCVRPPRRASENGWCVPPPESSKNSMLSRMFRTMWSMLLCPTSLCICCLILERATCGLKAKKVQYRQRVSTPRFRGSAPRFSKYPQTSRPSVPSTHTP